ncbi:MAG: DUF1501 domain-containing protein [Aliivibrio sp.]|uniref:DUF1501 domain-containing protein n=1 Tax=Aliivibrio sp. TaxID=1872443 RepID=UPI001A4403F1|nr:DUF1501 domain-containing protein [Aliivibrio sp.]
MKRRELLKSIVAIGVSTAIPSLAFASSQSSSILVWVTLRGAIDGLNVVVPYNDINYRKLRPTIGLNRDQVNDLDGFFGLNPALKNLYSWYENRELALIHACATPYRERSHFDGQKVLENGTDDPFHNSGWLNRLLDNASQHSSIAIDSGMPLILQGDAPSSSWYPNKLKAESELQTLLGEMLQSDKTLSRNFEQMMRINSMASSANGKASKQFNNLCDNAGKFLSSSSGPNIAVLELGGWDTHAYQGSTSGKLSNQLKVLDSGLATLKAALGSNWSRTVIMVASEFGRTAAENGSKGTDHGTANAMFVAGGAVNGGQVITRWPGLGREDLYQGRDLAPTTDMREVIKAVLSDHLSLSATTISRTFPTSHQVKPSFNLIRF